MKGSKVYHSYLAYCRKKAPKIEYFVRWLSEWKAIYQKKELYKEIKWTPDQK